VTTLLSKNDRFKIALDLTEEWEKAAGDGVMAMGGLIVRKEFAEANKEALDAFLKEYGDSTKYVNEQTAEASALIAKYEIMASAELAAKAIPSSNIVCVTGNEMKDKITNFYQVLFASNPKSVGGKLPGEDFYYIP
jgi:NitT/TauT family transport system substrate-binding protein